MMIAPVPHGPCAISDSYSLNSNFKTSSMKFVERNNTIVVGGREWGGGGGFV